MDIRQLEYFMHVANTLNITHAALRAHVSQPALSRQLRLLEEELGVRLFERKARGVVLTEAGIRLRDRARGLLSDLTRIREEVIKSDGEPKGTVRFAVSNSLTGILTNRVVARYRATYPAVHIRISEGTSMITRQTIVEDRADVALLSDREPSTSLQTSRLVTESLCLIAPVEAGLDMRKPVPGRFLADHGLVLTPFPNSLRRAVDEILVRANKIVEPMVEVDTNSLMMALVQKGAGYCVLPYSGAHVLIGRNDVSAAPIRNQKWTWMTAMSRDRAISAAARLLVEMIRSEAKALIDEGVWKTATFLDARPE